MNKYELVVIVNAALPQDEKEIIVKQAADSIAKAGGKVINSQIWLEKHRFAFTMKKCQEGAYYLINFESPAPAVANLREFLRLNENILRSAIIRAE